MGSPKLIARVVPFILALALGGCAVNPEPVGVDALAVRVGGVVDRAFAAQEPIGGAIDIYEAIARALKYNLDHRVEIMQQAVRSQELRLAHHQGLPALVAGGGYAGRDNTLASASESIVTGRQSLEPSTSSERSNTLGDITLSWNVLDFGLSYVRARQAADQVLIQGELRRKALNRIVEEVRAAYWRAVASEHLLARLEALEGRTRKALADSRALATERQTTPLVALSYERDLLEIRREALRIDGELRVARGQLAALMNIPPDKQFRLSGRKGGAMGGDAILRQDPRAMVRVALMNRPEVRENLYRARINERDADAALLELLPGVNVVLGANTDANRFLFHSNWVGWGAKASWNLMKVFQYPAKKGVIEAQGRVLDEQALALAVAITTQVHVSRARFAHARREFAAAADILTLQTRLLSHARAAAAADRSGEQSLLREQLNAVVAQVRHDLAYAQMQNALGTIYAALGLDAMPAIDIDKASVAELAKALRSSWVGEKGLPDLRQLSSPHEPVSVAASPPSRE